MNTAWKNTLEVIGAIGGITTVLALLLGPMFYLGSKIDAIRNDMQEDMKDFHGRLCAIEERNKAKGGK